MSIDNSTVKKVAKLARLKVDANEEQNLKNELNNILEWVDKLQKVNTENVDAMLSVSNEPMPMRKDMVTSKLDNKQILSNAPEKTSEV